MPFLQTFISCLWQCLVVSLFFVIAYIIFYIGAVDSTFSDDIDFAYGKKVKQRKRENEKNLLKKFFYLDLKKYIKKWHYLLFAINFCAAIFAFISLNAYVILNEIVPQQILLVQISGIISFALCGLTGFPLIFSYNKLYRWNMIRSKKEYRKGGQHHKR